MCRRSDDHRDREDRRHARGNIMEWPDSRGLSLTPHKTKAVLLIGGRINQDINVHMQKSMRFFGAHLTETLGGSCRHETTDAKNLQFQRDCTLYASVV